MIEIVIGNVGSGKTATAVKEMFLNKDGRVYFSNIKTKGISHNHQIKTDMIIKKTPVLNKKGGHTGKFEVTLNDTFWIKQREKFKQGINVIIDEAHTLFNARRSMSKKNVILSDFLALIRKILTSSTGKGRLVFMTQLPERIDKIARDMCTLVRAYKCHYIKECQKCKSRYRECNETVEKIYYCPECNSTKIKEINHEIEAFHFSSIEQYDLWKNFGVKTYHRHYVIKDIVNYFGKYDTLQIEDLLTEI